METTWQHAPFQHTQYAVYLTFSAATAGVLYDSLQKVVSKYHLNRKWFLLFGATGGFAYLYVRPLIRRSLGSASNARVNWNTIYILWLMGALFYHVPPLASLGLDVRGDLSMALTVFLLSLVVLALLQALHDAGVAAGALRPYLQDPSSTRRRTWSRVALLAACIGAACSSFHSFCPQPGAWEAPPAALAAGWTQAAGNGTAVARAREDNSFVRAELAAAAEKEAGGLRRAVCGRWLGPVRAEAYPFWASLVLYGQTMAVGGDGEAEDKGEMVEGESGEACAASTSPVPSHSSVSSHSLASSHPPASPHSPPTPPPSPIISTVFTMWLTLTVLLLCNSATDYAAASAMRQAELGARRATHLRRAATLRLLRRRSMDGGLGLGREASAPGSLVSRSLSVGVAARSFFERAGGGLRSLASPRGGPRLGSLGEVGEEDEAGLASARSSALALRSVLRSMSSVGGLWQPLKQRAASSLLFRDASLLLSPDLFGAGGLLDSPDLSPLLTPQRGGLAGHAPAAPPSALSSLPSQAASLSTASQKITVGADAPAPRFLPMFPWYSGTSADLMKTVFDLIVSVKLFLGRFDNRTLQAAGLQDEPPRDGDGVLFQHLARRDEIWLDFCADTGDGGDSTYAVARLLAAPALDVVLPDYLAAPPGEQPDKKDPTDPPEDLEERCLGRRRTLPRAQVLVHGGDLAYPNPTPETYGQRLFEVYEAALPPPAHARASRLVIDKPDLPRRYWTAAASGGCRPDCPSFRSWASLGGRGGGGEQDGYHGGNGVEPESYHGGNGVEPESYHGGNGVEPETYHGVPASASFVQTQSGTLFGGQARRDSEPSRPDRSAPRTFPKACRRCTRAQALWRYEGPTAFAIPGNHDWIDGLETFQKQIQGGGWLGGWLLPQERSYYALQLPKGWWLFGLDCALADDVDLAQYRYFAQLAREKLGPDDGVVVVTHCPHWLVDWYWGRITAPTLRQLLRGALKGRARVALAGDLHFYMRHRFVWYSLDDHPSLAPSAASTPLQGGSPVSGGSPEGGAFSPLSGAGSLEEEAGCRPGMDVPRRRCPLDDQRPVSELEAIRSESLGRGDDDSTRAASAGLEADILSKEAERSSPCPASSLPEAPPSFASPAPPTSLPPSALSRLLQDVEARRLAQGAEEEESSPPSGRAPAAATVPASPFALARGCDDFAPCGSSGAASERSASSPSALGPASPRLGGSIAHAIEPFAGTSNAREAASNSSSPALNLSSPAASQASQPRSLPSLRLSPAASGTAAAEEASSPASPPLGRRSGPISRLSPVPTPDKPARLSLDKQAGSSSRPKRFGLAGVPELLTTARSSAASWVSELVALSPLRRRASDPAEVRQRLVAPLPSAGSLESEAPTPTLFAGKGFAFSPAPGRPSASTQLRRAEPSSSANLPPARSEDAPGGFQPSAARSEEWESAPPPAGCERPQASWRLQDPEHLVVCGNGGAFLHPTHVFSWSRFRPVQDALGGPPFAQRRDVLRSDAEARGAHPSATDTWTGQAHLGEEGWGRGGGSAPGRPFSAASDRSSQGWEAFQRRPSAQSLDGGAGWEERAPAEAPGPARGEYRCARAYPSSGASLGLGRRNVHTFRNLNSRFDYIAGAVYFFIVVSALPRCDGVDAVVEAASLPEAAWELARAAVRVASGLFLESYVSLCAILVTFAVCLGFASSGGVGAMGDPSAAAQRSPELQGNPIYIRARLGGGATKFLCALLHCMAHVMLATTLLVLLELGVQTLLRHQKLGQEGYHAMYRWYRAYEAEAFADPAGLRARLERWTLGLYPGVLRWGMTLFDVPDLIAVARAQLCQGQAVSRAAALGYYAGVLAYYWVLATPSVGLLFGAYLYVTVNWMGVHYDEAFSSLQIPDYKGFLRLHVSPAGDLEIFSLALDRVPRTWREDPRWRGLRGGGGAGAAPSWRAALPSRWAAVRRQGQRTLLADQPEEQVRVVDYLKVPRRRDA